MEEIFKKYPLLKDQNVPRETLIEFELFISMLQQGNDKINIISKETAKNEVIRERHIVDSAQAIEFIDLNCDYIYDLGSGAGFPGIILGIILKNRGSKVKMKLFEKSYHKSSFLGEIARKLNLDIEIIHKDIFEIEELNAGTIMARAFKPMPVMFNLANEKFKEYKNLILFMGKMEKKF